MSERVVVFDDAQDGEILELAVQGAHVAKWTALAFNNPEWADEDLDISAGALIVSLATGRVPFGNYPALPLIHKSDKLSIPRALVSTQRDADDLIRPKSNDIIISKNELTLISQKVSDWLIRLSLER